MVVITLKKAKYITTLHVCITSNTMHPGNVFSTAIHSMSQCKVLELHLQKFLTQDRNRVGGIVPPPPMNLISEKRNHCILR